MSPPSLRCPALALTRTAGWRDRQANEQAAPWQYQAHRGAASLLRACAILPQIPPLGKHYSQRWAQEDLLEEQKDGARAAAVADKKKGLVGPLAELDTKGRSSTCPLQNNMECPEFHPIALLLCPLQMWMPC